MDKAVLVIDMPKACCKCPFFHSDFDIKRGACRANKMELTKDNFYFQKPDECPLKSLPEKKYSIPIEWIKRYAKKGGRIANILFPFEIEMMLEDWEKENADVR